MARMRFGNGAVVTVDDAKVESLTRRGFTAEAEPKKAPAKKAAPKSEK